MTFALNKLFNYSILIILWISIWYFWNQYISILWINIFNNSTTQKESLEKEIFSSEKIKKTIKLIQDYSYWFDKKSKIDIEDAM